MAHLALPPNFFELASAVGKAQMAHMARDRMVVAKSFVSVLLAGYLAAYGLAWLHSMPVVGEYCLTFTMVSRNFRWRRSLLTGAPQLCCSLSLPNVLSLSAHGFAKALHAGLLRMEATGDASRQDVESNATISRTSSHSSLSSAWGSDDE